MNIRIQALLFLLCGASFVKPWMYGFSRSSRRTDQKLECPAVKAIRNFDLESMMGFWYVVQYYASSEELPEYACMQSHFTFSDQDQHSRNRSFIDLVLWSGFSFTCHKDPNCLMVFDIWNEFLGCVTMDFTYIYAEDPLKEKLQGNITWMIPQFDIPAHWMHTEDIYEGIYNTYILDTDYNSWGLIMHCAEKSKSPRYLSALLLSRKPTLGDNVITFLREKLPRYDIDLSFMFPINQSSCNDLTESASETPFTYVVNGRKFPKNIFKIINKH